MKTESQTIKLPDAARVSGDEFMCSATHGLAELNGPANGCNSHRHWYSYRATRTARPASMCLCRLGVPLLDCHIADTWVQRLKGLLAYPPLQPTQALLLQGCSAVHTVGLRYAIDVLFLDRQGTVLRCTRLEPRAIAICLGSYAVLELAAGTIHRLNLQTGQQLTPAWRRSR